MAFALASSQAPRARPLTPTNADLTDALGSGGAGLEAVVALAAVAPHRVDAAAVLADAGLGAALVQVCRGGERFDEGSGVGGRGPPADSPVQPSPSGLRCIPGGQMHMKVPIRFLQVMPLESQSSRPSEHSSWSVEGTKKNTKTTHGGSVTPEGAKGGGGGGGGAPHLDTCAGRPAARSRRDTCTRRSRTCSHSGRRTAKDSGSTRSHLEGERERLPGLSGFTPHRHVMPVCQLTFAGHHGAGLEALLTGALEASHHVGAGSVPARVPDGALVGV